MNWYLKVLKQYADFGGRARRKEYWMFTLFNILIMSASSLVMIPLVLFGKIIVAIIIVGLMGCYGLAIFIPGLAVCVRRLHDIGKSGWFYLIGFIPLVGGIILLIWFCQDSETGANEYGPNPKEGRGGYIYEGEEKKGYNQPIHFPQLQCRVGYESFTYKMANTRITIGRDVSNDLILNHPTVSKRHAEIVFNGNHFDVIDLGSTNKVIVNGKFFQRTLLRGGDIIGLGEAVLTFYV